MTREYLVRYEQLPEWHPLHGSDMYRELTAYREERGAELQQKPLPDGCFGIIIEVNTSQCWTVQRPQLERGDVQEHVQLRLKEGHCLEEGLGGLEIVREEAFVPSHCQQSVYEDHALEIEIRPLGRFAWGGRSVKRSMARRDPMRYRQYRPGKNKVLRRELDERTRGGSTFTTSGELLAEKLHTGQPLWPHMIVRIIGRSNEYSHTIARSYYGPKTTYFPHEARGEMGVCYEVLYRPGIPHCS